MDLIWIAISFGVLGVFCVFAVGHIELKYRWQIKVKEEKINGLIHKHSSLEKDYNRLLRDNEKYAEAFSEHSKILEKYEVKRVGVKQNTWFNVPEDLKIKQLDKMLREMRFQLIGEANKVNALETRSETTPAGRMDIEMFLYVLAPKHVEKGVMFKDEVES